MSKEEIKSKIKNGLTIFLDSIRDYEAESGKPICRDERDSSEFADIFLESQDSFDFKSIISYAGNQEVKY